MPSTLYIYLVILSMDMGKYTSGFYFTKHITHERNSSIL